MQNAPWFWFLRISVLLFMALEKEFFQDYLRKLKSLKHVYLLCYYGFFFSISQLHNIYSYVYRYIWWKKVKVRFGWNQPSSVFFLKVCHNISKLDTDALFWTELLFVYPAVNIWYEHDHTCTKSLWRKGKLVNYIGLYNWLKNEHRKMISFT